MLAGALWLSCWWPGRCGGAVAGRGAVADAIGNQLLAEAQQRSCIGKPTSAHKREGPGRDLNISPEPLLFIALRKGNTPGDEAEPPFTACMQCWHALQAKLPTAFTSGICRRHAVQAKLPLQLCRDCKEGCSKCKNCVELWEYGKDKGVTEYILSV